MLVSCTVNKVKASNIEVSESVCPLFEVVSTYNLPFNRKWLIQVSGQIEFFSGESILFV